MKITVLGHLGMLGQMVVKYLETKNIQIETTNYKWPCEQFEKFIVASNSDFLINCIGSIPQKNSDWRLFKSINILLPIFLCDNFKGKIIHPTTDCEFNGLINKDSFYSKDNYPTATDDYGLSKAYVSLILQNKNNVKLIRTSIIGPEFKHKVSLMEWFLKQNTNINGYTNHYWNGITTLEWARQCYNLMLNWDKNPNLIQLGTAKITKYQLLNFLNEVFNCKKNIISKESYFCNKCLISDYHITDIEKQLKQLKFFYYK